MHLIVYCTWTWLINIGLSGDSVRNKRVLADAELMRLLCAPLLRIYVAVEYVLENGI